MRISDWSSDVCSSDLDRWTAGPRRRRVIIPADPRAAVAAVLCAGLLLFPAVGAASKQAMAPIAIVLALALLAAILLADRRAALPSRPVALLFAAFLGYVAQIGRAHV